MPLPYTAEELSDFVERNLSFLGTLSADQQKKHRAELLDAIAAMPPEFQVALVEQDIKFKAGSEKDLDQIGCKAGRSKNRVIFYDYNGNDEAGPQSIVCHETGHALDDNLMQGMFGAYSENDEKWRSAVTRELNRSRLSPRKKDSRIAVHFRAGANEIARLFRKKRMPSYAGELPLREHLYMYRAENFDAESFAEMTRHYLSLYKKYKGNDAQVDKILLDTYPELWPAYRDHALGEIQTRVYKNFPDRFTLETKNERSFAFPPLTTDGKKSFMPNDADPIRPPPTKQVVLPSLPIPELF